MSQTVLFHVAREQLKDIVTAEKYKGTGDNDIIMEIAKAASDLCKKYGMSEKIRELKEAGE